MGCTHSRSEDLYKKSFINSDTFMGSITDTPGYFSRTVHTLDFVESKFPNPTKTEMSYTGPPSHLQNSMDVHPFWSEFGREFQPTDRYHDMTNGDVPRGLLPGTDTAQEMRNLELKESLQDLRSQVKAKIKQVRPILEEDREEEQKPKAPADEVDAPVAPVAPVAPDAPVAKIDGPKRPAPPLPVQKLVKPQPELPKDTTSAKTPTPVKQYGSFQDEKSALDFLDSVISESMNLDDEDEVEVTTPATAEDTNWSLGGESFMKVEMRRRNLDKPVPGVMHGVAPVGTRNSFYTTDNEAAYNEGKNVLRTSMYLPESDFTSSHSTAAKVNRQQSLTSYRVSMPPQQNPLEIKSNRQRDFPLERTMSNGVSTVSIDTGIFSDSGTTNSASSNDSGIGSGATGVRDLVKIYNEQTRASADRALKRQSANLDNWGRAGGRPAPSLERRLSEPESLPLEESIRGSAQFSHSG